MQCDKCNCWSNEICSYSWIILIHSRFVLNGFDFFFLASYEQQIIRVKASVENIYSAQSYCSQIIILKHDRSPLLCKSPFFLAIRQQFDRFGEKKIHTNKIDRACIGSLARMSRYVLLCTFSNMDHEHKFWAMQKKKLSIIKIS